MARYSNEIKNRACEIYLECGNAIKVRKTLEQEYINSPEVLIPTATTIRNWANENNLNESLEQIQIDTIKRSQSKALERSVERREFLINSFQNVLDAGYDGVVGLMLKNFAIHMKLLKQWKSRRKWKGS